ncbi:MAG TPA: hypothetical protein VF765_30955, partial [Polyangiaceae bacterium]
MPTAKHDASVQALVAKLNEKTVVVPEVAARHGGPAERAVAQRHIQRQLAQPEEPAQATPPPVEEPAEPEAPGETEAAPETEQPAPKAAAKNGVSDRLRKSLEIERRALATKQRVEQERRRSDLQRREDEIRQRELVEREGRLRSIEKRIDESRGMLEREIRMLQGNPQEFMRRHGMDAAAITEFMKVGPEARRAELLETRVGQQLDQIQQSMLKRVETLERQLIQEREEAASRSFVEHVGSDVDRFEALNTIYS